MRELVKDVISLEEAKNLLEVTASADSFHTNVRFADDTPPIVQKVLDSVSKIVNFELHENSYWRVQPTPPNGIWWHVDTGNGGHMSWCSYGVSVLLTDEFGGRMKYRKDRIEEVVEGREKLDMYIHSSDEEHMVEPPDLGKTRTVLLLFI